MYKSASKNEQSRIDRHDDVSRHNTHGVDETVFKDHGSEREILIAKKHEMNIEVAKIKEQINAAKARYVRGEPGQMPYAVTILWEQRRLTLAREMREIDGLLKVTKQKEREDRSRGIERVFIDVAKEMLAEPVFQRLLTAAIHRAGEKFGD